MFRCPVLVPSPLSLSHRCPSLCPTVVLVFVPPPLHLSRRPSLCPAPLGAPLLLSLWRCPSLCPVNLASRCLAACLFVPQPPLDLFRRALGPNSGSQCPSLCTAACSSWLVISCAYLCPPAPLSNQLVVPFLVSLLFPSVHRCFRWRTAVPCVLLSRCSTSLHCCSLRCTTVPIAASLFHRCTIAPIGVLLS